MPDPIVNDVDLSEMTVPGSSDVLHFRDDRVPFAFEIDSEDNGINIVYQYEGS